MSEETKRCLTCIHWNKRNVFDRQRACDSEKVGLSQGRDGLWNDAATSNYLYTGPEFGCVHHEAQS